MEKKKLLLVAVSVGVVLLIIIGIPLMMIAPRQNQTLSLQPANDMNRNWGVAIEPNRTPLPEAVIEAPIPAFNTQPVEPIFSPPIETEAPQVTTITVPVPEAAAVPNTPAPAAPKRTAPAALTPATPAASKTAPASTPMTPKKETVKPAVAKSKGSASPSVASSAKKYDTYWVQTGAFSTKVRAEGAKDSLAAKGIASIIDNRDIDGKTWYRVRVGPYTSENEANYWLALVKSIDGFAESQIRLSQVTR